ncbi:transporter substrate-binding domain-containing protein [Aureimonas fodinaquatilis]|nr:transporter substrate-binding domain-containing protein [Aureimonas fodinaquatilis]
MKFSLKKWVMSVAAAAALTVSAMPAMAQQVDKLDQIRQSGELRIPVMVGEEPGYIRDRNTGEWGGFYVEWGKEIAEVLDVKVVPVETTWGNLAADFQANRIDIALGLNPNPSRGLVVDYLSVPLFTDAWALVARPDFDATTWNELNNPDVRLVVQSGGTMQVVAENLTPNATIVPVAERPLGVLELQSGRADAMIVAIFDALQIANQVDVKVIVPEPMLRNPATIGVARTPNNAGFINWLTNWVNQQRALGLAQAKLRNAFDKAGLDTSVLPANFSF